MHPEWNTRDPFLFFRISSVPVPRGFITAIKKSRKSRFKTGTRMRIRSRMVGAILGNRPCTRFGICSCSRTGVRQPADHSPCSRVRVRSCMVRAPPPAGGVPCSRIRIHIQGVQGDYIESPVRNSLNFEFFTFNFEFSLSRPLYLPRKVCTTRIPTPTLPRASLHTTRHPDEVGGCSGTCR